MISTLVVLLFIASMANLLSQLLQAGRSQLLLESIQKLAASIVDYRQSELCGVDEPGLQGLIALLSEDIVTRRAQTEALQAQNYLLRLPTNTAHAETPS